MDPSDKASRNRLRLTKEEQEQACDQDLKERKRSGAPLFLLQLKKGGVTKASGEGEKEKECTTERKSRRRRDENRTHI